VGKETDPKPEKNIAQATRKSSKRDIQEGVFIEEVPTHDLEICQLTEYAPSI